MKLNLSTLAGGLFACSLLLSCTDLHQARPALQQEDTTLAQEHWQNLADHGFPEAWVELGKIAEASADIPTNVALENYQRAYDLGYDRAAYNIGRYYYKYHQNPEDLKLVREWVLKSAQQGNLSAHLLYADMQLTGQGETENIKSALSIYSKLAEHGHASASRKLAYLYEKGVKVPQDKSKALDYFRQAVNQGSVESELDIARFYAYGYAVETDFDKAESTYLRFVESGNPQAAYLLGELYQRKSVIEGKNLLDKSVEWFKVSADRGYVPGKLRRIKLLLEGTQDDFLIAVEELKTLSAQNEGEASYRLGRLMNSGRVADNKKQELEYYQLAYKQGYELAAYRIAEYYFIHQQNQQDLLTAQQWQEKALQQQNDNARFVLAELTLQGKGWQQNTREAVELYQDLSDEGVSSASRALARIYEKGVYTEQNFPQALFYFERAVKQGDAYAELDVARFYADGLGVNSDWPKAKKIFLQYAQAGYPKAAFLLAKNIEQQALMSGQEMPEQAVHWYQVAAKQNNVSAKIKLIDMMLVGQGLAQNAEQATAELKSLSATGVAAASFRLGELNASEQKGDIGQALYYYQLAFQQGSKQATSRLAILYQQGHGLNNTTVRTAYSDLADAGNTDAAYLLGVLDEAHAQQESALHWYQKAAEQSHVDAQMVLVRLYTRAGNNTVANQWLLKAVQGGHAKALLQYGEAMFWGRNMQVNKIQGLAYVLSAARLHVSGAVTQSLKLMLALNNAEKIELANQRSKNMEQ